MHPTYRKLLHTALELLETHLPEEISSEMVLHNSGISKGSLYHHFEDFADLLETAMTYLFAQAVDENIMMMKNLFEQAVNPHDFFEGIEKFNQHTQAPQNRDLRFNRIRLLGLSYCNPRLTAKLAAEQDRMTAGYATLFSLAQERGWMSSDFDPHAASVLIQAYTLGRVIDDVSSNPVDPAQWNGLLLKVVTRVFGARG